MKTRLSLFLLIAIPLLGFGQNTDVQAAEQARFQAQVAQDTLALAELLHDELYYLHSNGLVESKQDFIRSVASGKIVYQTMEPQNSQLRRYGKMAILTGLVQVVGLYQGNTFELGLYYTSVYRKKRGKWYLVSWQSTKK